MQLWWLRRQLDSQSEVEGRDSPVEEELYAREVPWVEAPRVLVPLVEALRGLAWFRLASKVCQAAALQHSQVEEARASCSSAVAHQAEPEGCPWGVAQEPRPAVLVVPAYLTQMLVRQVGERVVGLAVQGHRRHLEVEVVVVAWKILPNLREQRDEDFQQCRALSCGWEMAVVAVLLVHPLQTRKAC